MLENISLVDCTIREAGYQTGWHFDNKFVANWYQFLLSQKVDYMELGFFHSMEHDPGKGVYRYCGQKNEEITSVFSKIKSRTKIASMLDLQRPIGEIIPADESIVDCIRIINRSHENNFSILENKVNELTNLGYEVCVNFTSAGFNSRKLNCKFLNFSKNNDISVINFADTESVFTKEFVTNLIDDCNTEGVENYGLHLHDKKGMAKELMDVGYRGGCRHFDATLLGFGGKWHDWNLNISDLFDYFKVN
ncbi:pyruvate carboxyltransferase, partial [Candidatus Woesearchaeota archaeon]|nr:pyruvate carboxyltransferase [Candidatus Woesearchaeota archaeon]